MMKGGILSLAAISWFSKTAIWLRICTDLAHLFYGKQDADRWQEILYENPILNMWILMLPANQVRASDAVNIQTVFGMIRGWGMMLKAPLKRLKSKYSTQPVVQRLY